MSNPETPANHARPTASECPSLSPERAFVVHFYAAPDGAAIEAGRAEHVRSGQTSHFGSWQELASFVTFIVGSAGTSPSTDH